jgi:hypothetical protein
MEEMNMKAIPYILTALLLATSPLMAVDPPQFNVKVSVLGASGETSSKGSGAFTVTEDECGRVALSFYGDGTSFAVDADSRQYPVARLSTGQGGTHYSGDLLLTADIYLRPNEKPDKEIHLSGLLSQMTRRSDKDEPLFTYTENKLDYVLLNGGEQFLDLDTGRPGHTIRLRISVTRPGQLAYSPPTVHQTTFQIVYSLFNQTTNAYEVDGCKSTLSSSADGDRGTGNAGFRKIFHLGDGTVLLYLSSFDINNVKRNDDHTLSFDFCISHIYAKNPKDTTAGATELSSDKTTMVILKKQITAQPGERTEIEIPIEKVSPLPFKGKEKIVLTNSVEEKTY